MNAVAEKTQVELSPPANMEPAATQLTPMQMAYQLMAKGADFPAVKEMLDYGRRLESEANEQRFNEAMAAAQKEMGVIATNMTNSQTHSRYADYAQLDTALRPIYTKHGFALSFNDGEGAPEGWVRILCYVTNSGHTRTYHKDMPADGKGAKGGDVMTKTHAVGAAQSYAMRYLLRMIFNVAVGEEDKDGNAPETVQTVTPEQVKTILDLIEKTETDIAKFCTALKIESVPDMRAKDFPGALTQLQIKLARNMKAQNNG